MRPGCVDEVSSEVKAWRSGKIEGMPLLGVVSHVSSVSAPGIEPVLPSRTPRPSTQESWWCGRLSGMLGQTHGLRFYLLRGLAVTGSQAGSTERTGHDPSY